MSDAENKFDTFLEDPTEGEEGSYIQPSIEHKLSKQKRQDCRDIVVEIKKFGISQRQLLYLIQLLALELENNDISKSIAKLIGEKREEVELTHEDVSNNTTKIILPEGHLDI